MKMSEAEKAAVREYNRKIKKARRSIYKTCEILSLICVIAAVFYPHYPVCMILLIAATFFLIMSNQFCDD